MDSSRCRCCPFTAPIIGCNHCLLQRTTRSCSLCGRHLPVAVEGCSNFSPDTVPKGIARLPKETAEHCRPSLLVTISLMRPSPARQAAARCSLTLGMRFFLASSIQLIAYFSDNFVYLQCCVALFIVLFAGPPAAVVCLDTFHLIFVS